MFRYISIPKRNKKPLKRKFDGKKGKITMAKKPKINNGLDAALFIGGAMTEGFFKMLLKPDKGYHGARNRRRRRRGR